MEELTISKLIAVLQSIQDNLGDMPACVWDSDTGWQMPVVRVIQTGDNVILFEGVGYDDDDRIRDPQRPMVVHWQAWEKSRP